MLCWGQVFRAVEGLYSEVIEAINRSGKPVVSVDIPSGINGDTGKTMGKAVQAAYTVTFGLPKAGNLLYPGYAAGGQLAVSHISFPPSLYQADSLLLAINDPLELAARDANGYKGVFGDALFIAGAATYFGAPYFSALSFMKAGGGYSRLAAPRSMIPYLAAKASEVVYVPQVETDSGSIALSNKSALLELIDKMDFVVMGPGLSLHAETRRLVQELAVTIEKPLLIDGDGLTAISDDLGAIRNRKQPTVLTPHLGEMARLTGLSIGEIADDKVAILRRTTVDLGATIVLKGAHSLVGYPDERVFINMSGNSGMATAGSGDVLTGAIAAMHGSGLAVADAVRQGVFVHGVAGDLAAMDIGEDGMTAQDILNHLPNAMHAIRTGLNVSLQSRYTVGVEA